MRFKNWIARLNESSLNDLYQSTVDAFPRTTKRQHAIDPVRIVELAWTPFLGMKTLFIKGTAESGESEYTTLVLFKNVIYNQESNVRIVANDGLVYEFQKPSFDDDVLVRCSCPDFRWRFAYYNHLDHSLYGKKPKRYVGLGFATANPLQMEGMCKHLIKTIKALKESGVIT